MKIINNKHTLLYIRTTIHSIQRYNGLCELPTYFIVSLSCAIESRVSTGGICCVQSYIGKIELNPNLQTTGPGE